MQNLRFSIAAGETKVFVIAGRYLEIIDATGPVTLGLYDVNGSQTDDAKDVLSGTYMEGAFSQFEIYSATAQTIELFLTNTRGGTRRQPGNVRVIDQSADQTAALNQYIAMNGVSDATKGVVAGLWAQTKPITVRAIQFGSSAAGGMAVLYGNGRPLTGQGAAPAPANKMIGSPAAASALPVSGTVAAAFPVTTADLAGVQTVGYTSVQAGTLYRVDLKTPVVIPVGKFFGFATSAANASVNFIAEIEE